MDYVMKYRQPRYEDSFLKGRKRKVKSTVRMPQVRLENAHSPKKEYEINLIDPDVIDSMHVVNEGAIKRGDKVFQGSCIASRYAERC